MLGMDRAGVADQHSTKWSDDVAVVILYGTETGTAEEIADTISDVIARHADTSVYGMDEYDVADLDPSDFHIIVCSTYGDGELPTGAVGFFDDLDADQPDLAGLRFAMFGLGDSIYDTFNHGSDIAADKLIALGAERVGEHARHDGSSKVRPRDLAKEWATDIAAVVSGRALESVSGN